MGKDVKFCPSDKFADEKGNWNNYRTCDEYRKYRDYMPHYDNWILTATPWYCGDKDSGTGSADYVRRVNPNGQFDINYAYFGYDVAPACVLNPKSLNLRKNMAYVEEVAE